MQMRYVADYLDSIVMKDMHVYFVFNREENCL